MANLPSGFKKLINKVVSGQIRELIHDPTIRLRTVAEAYSEYTTQLSLTGLDGDRDKWYLLFVRGRCVTGLYTYMTVLFNNDSGKNYWIEGYYFTGIQVLAVEEDFPVGLSLLFLYAKSGCERPFVGTSISKTLGREIFGFWKNKTDNIYEIDVVASRTSEMEARVLALF